MYVTVLSNGMVNHYGDVIKDLEGDACGPFEGTVLQLSAETKENNKLIKGDSW